MPAVESIGTRFRYDVHDGAVAAAVLRAEAVGLNAELFHCVRIRKRIIYICVSDPGCCRRPGCNSPCPPAHHY